MGVVPFVERQFIIDALAVTPGGRCHHQAQWRPPKATQAPVGSLLILRGKKDGKKIVQESKRRSTSSGLINLR